MPSRFLIIGSKKSPNTLDLITEIEELGHSVIATGISKLFFLSEKGRYSCLFNGRDILKSFDIVIFRAFNKNVPLARSIARAAIAEGITVIDEVLAKRALGGKLSQAEIFAQHDIPHPRTFHTLDKEAFLSFILEVTFPLIAKPLDGRQGQGVRLLQNQEASLKDYDQEGPTLLFQEYLPIESDMRIFVVGGEVLGGMRRYVIENDFRSNASLGAKTERFEPTQEIKDLALRSVAALGYEIAGVDIIECDGQLFVLEVNDTPQWQGFKRATGINPASSIVRYALAKAASKAV